MSRRESHLSSHDPGIPQWAPGGLVFEIGGEDLPSLGSIIELLTTDGRTYKCAGVAKNVTWEDVKHDSGWSSCIDASANSNGKEHRGSNSPQDWRSYRRSTPTENLRMRVMGNSASTLTAHLELVTTGQGSLGFTETPSLDVVPPSCWSGYDDKSDYWFAKPAHVPPIPRTDGAYDGAHSEWRRMWDKIRPEKDRWDYVQETLELVSDFSGANMLRSLSGFRALVL